MDNNINDYKDCPYCGEKIKKAATKCRYCQTTLVENEPEINQTNFGAVKEQSDNAGIISITLAIISFVLFWIPYFATLLAAIGAFFGYKGFKTSRRTLSIVATAICAVVLIINLSFSIFFSSTINEEQESRTATPPPSSSNVSSSDNAQAPKHEPAQSNLVTIEKITIIEQSKDYKILYPDMIEVIIKNNHTETIRNYSVGLMGFDQNGYPLKIEWNIDFSGGDYVRLGSSEDANVIPGATVGKDKGWGLDESHGIRYVLAEVYEVEFYDGEMWQNPNFDYWVNEYSEKQLPEQYRR